MTAYITAHDSSVSDVLYSFCVAIATSLQLPAKPVSVETRQVFERHVTDCFHEYLNTPWGEPDENFKAYLQDRFQCILEDNEPDTWQGGEGFYIVPRQAGNIVLHY